MGRDGSGPYTCGANPHIQRELEQALWHRELEQARWHRELERARWLSVAGRADTAAGSAPAGIAWRDGDSREDRTGNAAGGAPPERSIPCARASACAVGCRLTCW